MPSKVITKKATKTAKKVAVKPVAKKAAVKSVGKTSSKKAKLLVCAPDDKCFWTTDGRILKNLDELQMAFGSMGEEVFLHHVNKEKNDFADWVEQVLQDSTCASALRKTKQPTTAKAVVVKHLRTYNV